LRLSYFKIRHVAIPTLRYGQWTADLKLTATQTHGTLPPSFALKPERIVGVLADIPNDVSKESRIGDK